MPILHPDNQEVIEVYTRVMDQHIMGFGGPIALNLLAVDAVMDMIGVTDKKRVFERVRFIYNFMLKKQREQEEFERLAEKNR